MKKQLSFPFLLLFTMAFLWTGCEKTKTVAKEKNQIEKSVTEEEVPFKEAMPETEEAEIIEDKEKSVTTKNTPATDNQKFEGSQTLKRYMEDSP
ncbi:MAG: hypothetical protein IID17_13495 [Nitrospinae bacterium]|nr:hypothetical protein [Nitrospinota bacterium]